MHRAQRAHTATWMMLLLLCPAGCSSQSDGNLVIEATATELHVGTSATLFAKLADPTSGSETTVSVSWSASPDGVVTLAAQNLSEVVTAVGSGQVLVTASGYNQTQELGITVTP